MPETAAAANPHEYALIYGSPVPGYVAPVTDMDAFFAVALERSGRAIGAR